MVAVILAVILVPLMAGEEIRERFFSIEKYQEDGSAQSRFDSWSAAIKVAADHPVLGVGPRNSPAVLHAYGADHQGRAVHSVYLQLAADTGFIGAGFYIALMALAILRARRMRRAFSRSPDQFQARSLVAGLEISLLIYCIGAGFLSLETFELPYLLAMILLHWHWVAEREGRLAPVLLETAADGAVEDGAEARELGAPTQ